LSAIAERQTTIGISWTLTGIASERERERERELEREAEQGEEERERDGKMEGRLEFGGGA